MNTCTAPKRTRAAAARISNMASQNDVRDALAGGVNGA